jgi:hypothetical protein
MGFVALFSVLLSVGADAAAPPVALEFKDASTFDGRTVLQYRAIEFRDAPARPLSGEFKPSPGALYGLVPVGPKPETALSIVWCPKSAGGPELWLDANGDGRLSADERHPMPGRELAISATIAVQLEPQPKRVQRTLLFRRSALGDGLRYAVRGFAQGSLALGGAKHAVLLVDGNADGCLDTVGQDRVWIDLNGDGRFDALTEQFPLGRPIVKAGEVYVVRSDPLATAVSASQRSAAQGKLRLALARKPAAISQLSVELISDLGELVVIDKLDQAVPVPTGQYRVSWVKLEMADPAGQPWTYSFRQDAVKNYTVETGKETAVAMLDRLAMNVTFDRYQPESKPKPGETVVVSPRLIADESLYLSSCTIGKDNFARSAEATAEILLLSLDGKVIQRGITGFS